MGYSPLYFLFLLFEGLIILCAWVFRYWVYFSLTKKEGIHAFLVSHFLFTEPLLSVLMITASTCFLLSLFPLELFFLKFILTCILSPSERAELVLATGVMTSPIDVESHGPGLLSISSSTLVCVQVIDFAVHFVVRRHVSSVFFSVACIL